MPNRGLVAAQLVSIPNSTVTYVVLHQHWEQIHLAPCVTFHTSNGPTCGRHDFGKYNIFPQTWLSHVAYHGTSLSDPAKYSVLNNCQGVYLIILDTQNCSLPCASTTRNYDRTHVNTVHNYDDATLEQKRTAACLPQQYLGFTPSTQSLKRKPYHIPLRTHLLWVNP